VEYFYSHSTDTFTWHDISPIMKTILYRLLCPIQCQVEPHELGDEQKTPFRRRRSARLGERTGARASTALGHHPGRTRSENAALLQCSRDDPSARQPSQESRENRDGSLSSARDEERSGGKCIPPDPFRFPALGGGVTACAGQDGHPLTERAVEAFIERRLPHGSPVDRCNRSLAWPSFPEVTGRVPSPTRVVSVRVMTVTMHRAFHIWTRDLPRPTVSLTVSRKVRLLLLGEAAHPSVATMTARTPAHDGTHGLPDSSHAFD